MPWEGGIICPECGELMVMDNSTTEYEFELWHCEHRHTEAEARHPVQYPYIAIGQEDERQGLHRRVIKKEIIGAELYVFYETPIG
ncbi:MAG TPA: hypothetical protein VEU97_10485 [Ktedonobacteraceae bacterium]|jgi:DNA-directed RNA polymerase subunit M/transcription elongation factor TFIIS|nr:hypothetical protein [Ktedonobacteraceae bacterium]